MATKYSPEFKLKLLKEYFNVDGEGATVICKKHGVPITTFYDWVDRYKVFGKEYFLKPRKKATYTREFKKNVLEYMISNGTNFDETARIFKIPRGNTVLNWYNKEINNKKYKEGLPKDSMKTNELYSNKISNKGVEIPEDYDEMKKLLVKTLNENYEQSEIIRHLEMENLYEKKSRSLLLKEEESVTKKKQK